LYAEIYANDVDILRIGPFLGWIFAFFEAPFMDYNIAKAIAVTACSRVGVGWVIFKEEKKTKKAEFELEL